jgi:RHS repeat-associated protein
LGSIHDVVSTSGVVIDHIRYSAFGIVAAESSPSNGDRFKFTAREYDFELAHFYQHARHYDPPTGRFLSKAATGINAKGANRYAYAINAPNVIDDPPESEKYDISKANQPVILAGGPDKPEHRQMPPHQLAVQELTNSAILRGRGHQSFMFNQHSSRTSFETLYQKFASKQRSGGFILVIQIHNSEDGGMRVGYIPVQSLYGRAAIGSLGATGDPSERIISIPPKPSSNDPNLQRIIKPIKQHPPSCIVLVACDAALTNNPEEISKQGGVNVYAPIVAVSLMGNTIAASQGSGQIPWVLFTPDGQQIPGQPPPFPVDTDSFPP